ncbi:MAG: ATP-binding protein [Bacteroidales bacterium]|nr:ATP-binding protein [Bacteroidales bacterium]
MNTPFTFGKTVSGENFTDRENDTAKLVSNLQYGVNTFIVSPRRWGKTSLVKKAKSMAENERLKIVYVDVQQCRSEEEFCERYASAVLTQTANKMDEWLENAKTFLSRFSFGVNASPDPSSEMSLKIHLSSKERSNEDLLQLPESIAKRKKIHVVVCVDEFQQIGNFADTLQFQTKLRSVWQHHELTSYCLFGSRKHMMETLFDDPSKPFYKFGDIIYLQRIPTDYWINYITKRFRSAKKTITKKQAVWIVEQVDGNSSYVQQLSWYVFQRTQTKVTANILSDALQELVDQCRDLFETKTENLTAYQMNFLKAVADGVHSGFSTTRVIEDYRLGSSANVSIVKKALIEKDLIIIENQKVIFNDPVMGLWLKTI